MGSCAELSLFQAFRKERVKGIQDKNMARNSLSVAFALVCEKGKHLH